jgi:dolichol-phosphate mannosyltransferase
MDGTNRPAARRLSLVLPAYNEGDGVRRAVAEADDALAGLVEDYEILVVDDGSRDGTADAARAEAAGRPRVRVLSHERNRGYGAALRTGFAAARFELVAFTDADCQFHLDDLARLLPLTERCPVAVGWRDGRRDGWLRRFASRGYNLLTRSLLGTGVRDCDCALKVFRREALERLTPESDGFFVNAELLARARQLGLAVAEAAVRHRPRSAGASKVRLADVPRALAALLPFWWSRVLFPAGLTDDDDKPERFYRGPLALALLLTAAALLFLTRLKAPLLEPQEPRYAEIARQMLAENRWLVPTLHGQDYLDKPPLLYWLLMASYRLFGVHDWAARMVPGLAGVLTVLTAWLWARRGLGARAAFWGALALCLSARFVYLGRMLVMDGLLALWTTAALAAAHRALTGGPRLRWRPWLLSAAACGLGLLTKGPVALVLVAVPLLAFAFLDRRCPRVGWGGAAAYLGAALGLAAPWFTATALARPGFAAAFFWRHHVVRFAAPFDHQEPVWFYLPGLLLGLMPWTLLLPGLVCFLARRSARAGAQRPSAFGFFLLAFLWPLLFFSASGCKRAVYLLPALPPLALALGGYLAVLVPQTAQTARAALRRPRLARAATLSVLALALGGVALAGAVHMLRPGLALALAGGVLVLLIEAACVRAASWTACAAATFAVLLAGVQFLLPAYNRQFALRGDLHANAEQVDPQTLRIACYPQRYDSASFYLPEAEVRVYTAEQRGRLLADLRAHPETLLLVRSGRTLHELLDELPGSLEFVPRRRPQGAVAVGWVRARAQPTGGGWALWASGGR